MGVLHGTGVGLLWRCVAAWGALLFVRLSTLVVIVAKTVVRVPRAFLTSFRVALSSILDSCCCDWN